MTNTAANFSLKLTPRVEQKIEAEGGEGPWSRQFLISSREQDPSGLLDPIGDQLHQKTPSLIHRYTNRALFLPTRACSVHCRYCFRRNELEDPDLFRLDLAGTTRYLREHPEIEEIIFTGGDPLSLSDSKLKSFIDYFKQFPSIKYLRLHTRTPVVMPERLTPALAEGLSDHHYQRLVLTLHTNHPHELDEDFARAVTHFQSHLGPTTPLLLNTQTVLLKGVNDHLQTLTQLFQRMVQLRLTPYYLHHPDRVRGAMHFYLSPREGLQLYRQLRQKLPGWAIPHYVIDSPDGHGKQLVASQIDIDTPPA